MRNIFRKGSSGTSGSSGDISKKEEINFKGELIKDWGKEDVFGPWTPDGETNEDGTLKFYQSYWLITSDNPITRDMLE